MFEGASLDARKYIAGYKLKWKNVEKFEWRIVGVTPTGRSDWRYIVLEEWKDVLVPIMKTAPIARIFKTDRDWGKKARRSGTTRNVHENRFVNRALRIAWDYSMKSEGTKGGSRKAIPFPIEQCNGKRSRAIKESKGPRVYKN